MRMVVPSRAQRPGRFRRMMAAISLAAVVALWLWAVWWAGGAMSAARVLAAPAAASATAYLPVASELPGAFREQATVDVGGLREPDRTCGAFS